MSGFGIIRRKVICFLRVATVAKTIPQTRLQVRFRPFQVIKPGKKHGGVGSCQENRQQDRADSDPRSTPWEKNCMVGIFSLADPPNSLFLHFEIQIYYFKLWSHGQQTSGGATSVEGLASREQPAGWLPVQLPNLTLCGARELVNLLFCWWFSRAHTFCDGFVYPRGRPT